MDGASHDPIGRRILPVGIAARLRMIMVIMPVICGIPAMMLAMNMPVMTPPVVSAVVMTVPRIAMVALIVMATLVMPIAVIMTVLAMVSMNMAIFVPVATMVMALAGGIGRAGRAGRAGREQEGREKGSGLQGPHRLSPWLVATMERE